MRVAKHIQASLAVVAVVVEWLACLPVMCTQKIRVRFYLERESSATSG